MPIKINYVGRLRVKHQLSTFLDKSYFEGKLTKVDILFIKLALINFEEESPLSLMRVPLQTAILPGNPDIILVEIALVLRR